jgi:hypothetical protein
MSRNAGVKNGWTTGSAGVNNDWTEPAGSGGGGITVPVFNAYKAELDALVLTAFEVDDTATNTTNTWSSTRISAEIAAI